MDVIGDQKDFMSYFMLAGTMGGEQPRRNTSVLERSLSPKKKRPTPRTRKVISKKEKDLEMLIPFSSPAGIVLTKKAVVGEKYIVESLEEIEAACVARPFMRLPPRMKHRMPTSDSAIMHEMRKQRLYYWPKRTLHSESREINFQFIATSVLPQSSDFFTSRSQIYATSTNHFQNFGNFSCTTQSTNIVRLQHASAGDVPERQGVIQDWIQNVNGENNFVMANQVS